MKKIFCLIGFITISIKSGAQLIFQKTFSAPGNQNAIAAMQSASDDYYILSETDSGQNNSKDFLLLKLDVSGNLVWSKYFGTSADDVPTDVKEMSSGKIMLCGYTYFNGVTNADILLINIDTAGTVIWSKTYGGAENDFGNKMAAASDSSVVIAGQTFSYGVINSSGYALKVTVTGSIAWSLTTSFNGAANSNASFSSVDNTPDGGFIFTGCLYSNISTNFDMSVVKTDVFGSVVAAIGIGPVKSTRGNDIRAIPGGDFIVVGKERDGTADSGSVSVIRVNPLTMSTSFVKDFVTVDDESANAVVVTPDGNFAFVGTSLINTGFGIIQQKGFLSKISLTGNSLYNKIYQPTGIYSSLNSIIVTHDNNLLLSGRTLPGLGLSANIYVIKARLNDGVSGCNENSFSYSINQLNHVIYTGPTNNFGGIAATVAVSDSSANVFHIDLCTTLGFQELTSDISTQLVYPNPSAGNFVINFNNNPSEKTIQIFDVTGNIIYKKDKIINAEEEINLTEVSKGIYFLKIIDQDKTSVNKIVLQ